LSRGLSLTAEIDLTGQSLAFAERGHAINGRADSAVAMVIALELRDASAVQELACVTVVAPAQAAASSRCATPGIDGDGSSRAEKCPMLTGKDGIVTHAG